MGDDEHIPGGGSLPGDDDQAGQAAAGRPPAPFDVPSPIDVPAPSDAPSALTHPQYLPQAGASSNPRTDALVTGAAYGALAALGLVLGIFGSFLFSGEIGMVPVSALVLTLINFICFWVAGLVMKSPLGALVPAAAWMIVVVLLSVKRPEGDLVITGTRPGYVFMIGGMVAGLVAIVFALSRSAGSWLLRGADPGPRAR